MKKLLVILLAPLALAGCLEIDQHPAWVEGYYDGKADNRKWDNPRFQADRRAWLGVIHNRQQYQNEYHVFGTHLQQQTPNDLAGR